MNMVRQLYQRRLTNRRLAKSCVYNPIIGNNPNLRVKDIRWYNVTRSRSPLS